MIDLDAYEQELLRELLRKAREDKRARGQTPRAAHVYIIAPNHHVVGLEESEEFQTLRQCDPGLAECFLMFFGIVAAPQTDDGQGDSGAEYRPALYWSLMLVDLTWRREPDESASPPKRAQLLLNVIDLVMNQVPPAEELWKQLSDLATAITQGPPHGNDDTDDDEDAECCERLVQALGKLGPRDPETVKRKSSDHPRSDNPRPDK